MAEAGTALVVEDEDIVRQIVERMFERLGFEVVTAEHGEAGLAAFEADPARFTIVYLDLSMPRMSGDDTLRAIRAVRDDVPVVVASGYPAGHERLAFLEALPAVGFLSKPFGLAALRALVGTLLPGA